MTDSQKNKIDKVDGSLNITEQGDVNNVMQFFLNDANQRVKVEETITRDDVVKVYSHLRRRWESAYDTFKSTFPSADAPPNTDHAPALRGELELLSNDIARVKIMVARLNHAGVDEQLVKASDFKMAYMQPIEAFRHIEKEREAARRRSQPAPSGGCYVVTATYGLWSRESVRVHRRCKNRFLLNPLFTCGWLLYRFYGPLLARWAKSNPRAFQLNKQFVAAPIVAATDSRPLVVIPAMAYLLLLCILGAICLPPAYLLSCGTKP